MKYSRTMAAIPATAGVAIDVPLLAINPLWNVFSSAKGSACAEKIHSPVPRISGLIRAGSPPTEGAGPLEEKLDSVPTVSLSEELAPSFSAVQLYASFIVAPTERPFLKLAGLLMLAEGRASGSYAGSPQFPAANSTNTSGFSHMNRLTDADWESYPCPL